MRLILHKGTSDLTGQSRLLGEDKITLLLLFLGALNIFNRDTYCFFIAFAWCVFANRKMKVSTKVAPILFFSFALMLFWKTARGTVTTMLSTFTYPICFVMGYGMLAKYEGEEEREYVFAVLVICLAAGNWLHMMLNAVTNLGADDRNTVDIWTGTIISATGQAGLGVMSVGVSVAMLFSDVRWKHKLLAAGVLGLVMWYNLTLAGRTLIVIAVVAVLVALGYRLHIRRGSRERMLLAVLAAVTVILFLYSSNIFGIRDMVLESNLYRRFTGAYAHDVTEFDRMGAKLEYVERLLDHPFGGAKIHQEVGGYAHDLYLDTYDEAGIFAFLALTVFILQSLVTAFRLLKSEKASFNMKMLTLCILVCLHMEFWVEPILVGFDWMIAFYCAIYGAMTCMADKPLEDDE